ncbi:SubName: Full=Uncharacterized protein {ECO:0000313/EMBL:CCA68143.1} [Serendipita indica DSM 11827]|nr:SubName: Full=Uncharacterized protein {ECO:0000313/EMBL:CCA68143.1} [Serendipita indica DSM 11827]
MPIPVRILLYILLKVPTFRLGPPLPEKGGLPTIIVTPADSSGPSEFEIHFYSPKASETTFGNVASPSQGFMPRMRSFFRRSSPIGQQPPTQIESSGTEKASYRGSAYEEDIAEARCNVNVNVNIINVHGSSAEVPRIIVSRPTRNGGYVSIPQDEEMGCDIRRRSLSQESEDEEEDIVMDAIVVGVPTISEQDWTALNMPSGPLLVQNTGSVMGMHDSTAPTLMVGGGRPSFLTRRMRTLLFLSIPVALVGLHFFNHYMPSFFGSPDIGAQESTWFDVPSAPLSGPTF